MACADYEVLIEDSAEADLSGIVSYITANLSSPGAAQGIYDLIKQRITSLDQSPARCALVRFEPHRSRGVRWISAGNYQVFLIINEATCQVHILRILYARRLWERLL
ncbi:MAG: type II toxin-antitoxin system RelE/ParE family toxin [Coriobacteriales bacterium]|jgi:plasmid stabilization system protein ParE|nr:type II toxin-antitoxin system RelE/ParE family toxin [Coriobacteriales bacterium]